MYLTKFHKAVLNDIWNGGLTKQTNPNRIRKYDLEKYLVFYNKWYKEQYKSDILKKNVKTLDPEKKVVFAGLFFPLSNNYWVDEKKETEMILALKEFDSLLRLLLKDDLINVINYPLKKENVGLYVNDKPFNDGLNIVKEFYGKEIQVREGYKKYRKNRYKTQEEMLRLIFMVFIPLAAAIVGAFITIFGQK